MQDEEVPEGGTGLFGYNLRKLREKAGMSQTALAVAMKEHGWPWHQSTVYRVESGRQKVSFDEAVALAEIFGTSLDRFTWSTTEASAAALFGMAISRAEQSLKQIATATASLLWAQWQLEGTTASAERNGYHGSDRIRNLADEARQVMQMTPEAAVEEGRRHHEESRITGARLAGEDGGDDGTDAQGEPRVDDQLGA